MDPALVIAVAIALAFAVTNGLHDASNAIATLVATRAATPLQAILLASFFNMLGPLLVGAAVADTIAGIVTVPADQAVAVIDSGLAAAVIWNRDHLAARAAFELKPCSGRRTGRCRPGSGRYERGGVGGLEGLHPVGVFGSLIALAISPVLGFSVALGLIRLARTRPTGRPAAGTR